MLETPENKGFRGKKRTKMPILCSGREEFGTGKRGNWLREEQPWPSCKSPRTLQKRKYHITRQITYTSVLGDLLELHPWPCDSLITHRIPESRPGGSLIWRRYGGGVGNRCRWVERFALSEQRPMWQQGGWALILLGARIVARRSCELANPAQVRQIASQTGVLFSAR